MSKYPTCAQCMLWTWDVITLTSFCTTEMSVELQSAYFRQTLWMNISVRFHNHHIRLMTLNSASAFIWQIITYKCMYESNLNIIFKIMLIDRLWLNYQTIVLWSLLLLLSIRWHAENRCTNQHVKSLCRKNKWDVVVNIYIKTIIAHKHSKCNCHMYCERCVPN